MRFIENGPNIPDELLEARDKGEVIFICGAGISIPAGLPSFAALAKGVVSDLGVSKSHRAHLLLDRALNAEEDDYPPYDLSNVLNMIADAEPDIRQDMRWVRLHRLADVG